MIKKHAKVKALLFDGSEQEIVSRSFDPAAELHTGGDILFDDFINNSFDDLPELIGNDDFNAIVKSGGFSNESGFLDLYKNEDGMRLYFYKRGNMVFVFAYGEFQPTRYQLYLEGIWELA